MFESDGKVGQILQACFSPAPKNVVLQYRRRFFFLHLLTEHHCCSLQQEAQPEWSECEEVCVPEGACWQRSLLFHTEKLPTLGFVYSWIIEDARASCVCASVCECVSCLNTATVCLTLWLRKHSHSACLKATGAQVHMAVTSQWRRVCLFFLFLSSRPAWLMKKMPVRGRSHPRRERSHWTWTFSTYFCI